MNLIEALPSQLEEVAEILIITVSRHIIHLQDLSEGEKKIEEVCFYMNIYPSYSQFSRMFVINIFVLENFSFSIDVIIKFCEHCFKIKHP